MAISVRDLGNIDGPVAIYGGPYSNLQATQAMIARLDDLAPQTVICTGDLVAYCADPVETIAAVRSAGHIVVAGNCERQLAEGQEDCGCGFAPGTTCDRLSAAWFAHANGAVNDHDRAWMATLPDMVVFTQMGTRTAVIHGGATDIARFIWSTSPAPSFEEEVAAIKDAVGPIDRVMAGHSGFPFVRRVAGVEWINAGVIGMPPHDGARAVRFAILDPEPSIQSLDYDWSAARDAMVAAGLTQGYHTALQTGIWPSEDVLPQDLRKQPETA